MSHQILVKAFAAKLATGEKIFVPYIIAADAGWDILEARLYFLQEAGATAVELGVPFSDPVADGPTIQAAGQRALANGTSLTTLFETLQAFKERRALPVILMTYFNPIYTYGVDAFAKS